MIYLYSIGLVCLIICCGLLVGTGLGKVELNILQYGSGSILGIYLLYLVKVIYIDDVNKNIRFSDEIDFNKPNKKEIMEENKRNDTNNKCGSNKNIFGKEFSPNAPSDATLEKIKKTVVLNDKHCLQD